MGTRSAVCEPYGDSYRGRYVHWDGYPTGVGRALLELVARDGLAKVRQTIIHDHYGWSNLKTDQALTSRYMRNKVKRLRAEAKARGDYYSPEYDTPEYDAHNFVMCYGDGRFAQIPGYGVAYTTSQGQSNEDEWVTPDEDYGTEWRYILGDDSIWVLQGYAANPPCIGRVPYGDFDGMVAVEERPQMHV